LAGACLVGRGDESVLNEGYGLAVREEDVPNTRETVFAVGSITKQFTAAAVLKLEEMGELATGDAIGRFVDDVPEDKAGITLHHLLTHTSGLPTYMGDDYEVVQRDETVAQMLAVPLRSVPGADYAYSNAGYSLLAAIVELTSGVGYEEFLQHHLFAPAGLEATGYVVPDWSERVVAHWYAGEADNGTPLEKPYPLWNLIGNGDMLSTTEDMWRWHRALRDDAVLSAASRRKLFTPYAGDYGYGWRIAETPFGTLVEHDGASSFGCSASFKRFLDEDVVIVLFSNQSYGSNPLAQVIEDQVTAAAFGEAVAVPPHVRAGDHSHRAGSYEFPDGGRFLVSATHGALLVEAERQQAIDRLAFGLDGIRHQDLNRRAERLVFDGAALRQEVSGDETRYERYRRRIAEWTMDAGGDTAVSATRTTPSHLQDVVVTDVRVGMSGVRAYWRNGELFGLGEGDAAGDERNFGVVFAQTSGGDFAGFHLGVRRTDRIAFERDALVHTVNGRSARAART
jgi:CubicO group peptidase (beta-lactamase class C family)